MVVCSPLFIYAQGATHAVRGNISNEEGEALEHVIVQLLDNTTGKILDGTRSNTEGRYSLEANLLQKEYQIKFFRLGYTLQTQTIVFTPGERAKNLDVILQSKSVLLNKVIVRAKTLPVKIRADTTYFNLQKFMSGREENLRDMLQKLPGITVKGGRVFAKGRLVKYLLIEGDEFFKGSQHNLALDNVSAKMVDSLSLIEGYQKKKIQRNKDIEREDMAINIGIDEKYKNRITGNLQVGAGFKKKYDIRPTLFRLGNKTKFSYIGSADNLSTSGLSYVGDRVNQKSNLNFFRRFKNTDKVFDGYIAFDHLLTENEASNNQSYFINDRWALLNKDQWNNSQNKWTYEGNVNLTENSNNKYLKYTLNFSVSDHANVGKTISDFQSRTNQYDEAIQQTAYSINFDISYLKVIGKDLFLDIETGYNIQDTKDSSVWGSNISFLNLPFPNADFYRAGQRFNEKKNAFRFKTKFSVKKKRWHLEQGVYVNYYSDLLTNRLLLNDIQHEHASYLVSYPTIGLFFQFVRKFKYVWVKTGFKAFNISANNNNIESNKTYLALSPLLKIRFFLWKTHKLTIEYNTGHDFIKTIESFNQNRIINFRSRYIASMLDWNYNVIRNTLSVSHAYSNPTRGNSLYLVMNYTQKKGDIAVSKAFINTIESRLNYQQVPSTTSFFAAGNLKKNFYDSYFSIGLDTFYTKINALDILNNIHFNREIENLNTGVDFQSLFIRSNINFTVGAYYKSSNYLLESTMRPFHNSEIQYYATIRWAISKALTFNIQYNTYRSFTQDLNNKNHLLNAQLRYNYKLGKWRLSLDVVNLLNLNRFTDIDHSFGEGIYTQSSRRLQGGHILLKARYSIL